MKCEGKQGWFLNDIFPAVAILYLEFFNTKELKLFRRKRDAMNLIRKKFLPSLFLSWLVLFPTQSSNSDVLLTVGYLFANTAAKRTLHEHKI